MAKDKTWFEFDHWMVNTASIVAARKTEDADGKVVEVYLYTAKSLERVDYDVPTDEEKSRRSDAPPHYAGPQAQVVWDFLKWGAFDLNPHLDLAKRDWDKPPGEHVPPITVEETTAWLMQSILLIGDFNIRYHASKGVGDDRQVQVKLPGMAASKWMTIQEAAEAIHFVVEQAIQGQTGVPW